MESYNSFHKDEDARNLQRVFQVFASKQEDWIEESGECAMAAVSDRTWDGTEQAFGLTMEGAGT
jgi:hypothetical protein